MVLDEPEKTDTVFDVNGFRFLVDEDLLLKAAPIKIDFAHFGFQLDCSLEFEKACSLPNV